MPAKVRPAHLTLAIAMAAGPGMAQTLAHGPVADIAYGRVIAALLLCLALGAGAAWVMRARLGSQFRAPSLSQWFAIVSGARPQGGARLTVVERLRVSPQLEVCLLACEGRRYLIASSPTGTILLDKDLPADVGQGT